jgi:hypothetical protein
VLIPFLYQLFFLFTPKIRLWGWKSSRWLWSLLYLVTNWKCIWPSWNTWLLNLAFGKQSVYFPPSFFVFLIYHWHLSEDQVSHHQDELD